MANKPINKQYLKDTLLRFKEQVLNNEYARRTDIVEGHTHSNKETLDKFSEFSDGTLLFNGNEISSEWEDIGNKPFESLDNNTLGVENGVLKVVNVQETMQVSELPAPTVDTLDKIYQYIGTNTSDYTNGLFYKCEEVLDSNGDITGYTWNELSLQTEEEINRYVLKEELENHAMSVSHITSGERTAWNNKAELADIPTKVSDLQDDVNLSDIHSHTNKEDILDKLSANSNGQLLFNNELVLSGIEISSDPDNIIENKPDGICASVDLSDYAKTNDVITSSATRTESAVDSAISNTHNHTNKPDVLDKLGTNADGKLTFDNTVIGTNTEISQDADNAISLGSDGGVYYRPDHTHSNKDYLDKIGEDNGEFTYNGNRISSDIEISTRANNALQRESDGSYYVDGTTSSTTQIQISAETDNNISLNADGLYVPKPKISTESGNALVENNGLYVPQNTVEISSEADNQIESKSDGIYVAKSPVQTVNNQTPDSNRNITLTLDNVEDGTTRKIPQFESENLSKTYSGSDKVVSSQYLNQQFANKSDILDKLGKNTSGSLTFDGTDVASASVNISQNVGNIIEQADDGIYATVDLSPYATTIDIESDYLTKESAQQTYMKSETYVDENGEILGEKIKPQSISYSDLENIGELDGVNIEQKLLQHLANTQIHNIGSLNSILINASEWDKGTLTNFVIESDGTMGLAHATENPISYVLDTATFVSKIYDVGSEMPFTTLNFDAVYNPYLSNISLYVRSGSTDTYSSSTWTDWVDVTQTSNLVGVNARYVQLKIEGNTVNEYKNIKFNYVQIYYGQDSDVELANARVGVNGTNYGSLKNRLDYIEQDYVKNNQGADNAGKTFKVDELGNVVLTDNISIQVDDALSDTSINPVENRIVTNKLNIKGETLFYDEDNGQLQLKCGDEVLSSVTIVSGRNTNFLLGEPSSAQLTNLDEAVEIKWTDPDDVIIGGSTLATWSGTVVVRKAGSAPMDKTDGIIIIDSRTKNQYSENGFVDTGLSNDVTYYYGIFPYSTEDAYTNTYTDSIIPTAIYPTSPIDVSLIASNEQIEVTFTKPSDATGIRIVYSTTEPTSETDGTIINTTESPYTITRLTNDTTYYIVVYSYNEKGRFSGSDILSEQPYGSGLVAWTTGSDRAIINMVNAYYNGDITLDEIKSVWSVGDTREMNLSAMEAEYVGEMQEAQTVELTIIDFDHDDLVNSVNGKNKSLVTVQTKNCLDNGGYMNSTVTNDGGWEECSRRSWCNDTFKNAVPSIISNSIKNVIKENYKVYNDTTITTTSDYCFLLSETEVFGSYGNSVGAEEGVQYEYYKTTSNRVKYSKGFSTLHNSVYWWERSPYVGGSGAFCDVYHNGTMDRCIAPTNNGLSPAFCL